MDYGFCIEHTTGTKEDEKYIFEVWGYIYGQKDMLEASIEVSLDDLKCLYNLLAKNMSDNTI